MTPSKQVAEVERQETAPDDMILFRKEVITNIYLKEDHRLGSEGRAYKVLIWLSIVPVIIILIGGFTLSYTKKVSADGLLVPEGGVVKVMTPEVNRVVSLAVVEGQRVRRGQELYELSRDIQITDGYAAQKNRQNNAKSRATMQQSISGIEMYVLELQRKSEREIQNVQENIRIADRQILDQKMIVSLYKKNYERYVSLHTAGNVTSEELEAKQSGYLSALNAQHSLERDRQLSVIQVDKEKADVQTRKKQQEQELSRLQENLAQLSRQDTDMEVVSNTRISSPMDGVITSIRLHTGANTVPYQTMLTIVPDERDIVAEIYVPSSAVGLVREGHEVLLKCDAFPYQKYGFLRGRVLSVSKFPMLASEIAADFKSGLMDEPKYRITISIDNDEVNLLQAKILKSPGMNVRAEIAVERKKIYQWIFDPLMNVARGAGQ